VIGVDQIIGSVGEEGMTLVRAGPLRRRIGAEMNLGVMDEAAPNAASSNVTRCSRVARTASSLSSSGLQSLLGTVGLGGAELF
jgi:hypothetical protein